MTVKQSFLPQEHTHSHITLQTSGDQHIYQGTLHGVWSANQKIAKESSALYGLSNRERDISAVKSKLLWSLQIVELLSDKYAHFSYVVSSLKTTSIHMSLHAKICKIHQLILHHLCTLFPTSVLIQKWCMMEYRDMKEHAEKLW